MIALGSSGWFWTKFLDPLDDRPMPPGMASAVAVPFVL